MTQDRYLSILDQFRILLKSDKKALEALDFLETRITLIETNLDKKDLKKTTASLERNQDYPLPKEIQSASDFALFSDGGCRGNPGPGSWGVVAQNSKGHILFESSSFDDHTTNNKMELLGAIKSIELLKESGELSGKSRVFLYTDSKYVVDGITSWVKGWKKRGWKKADGKTVMNLELWKKLDTQVNSLSFFKAIWVKGHNGHPQNERCDELCNIILDREFSS